MMGCIFGLILFGSILRALGVLDALPWYGVLATLAVCCVAGQALTAWMDSHSIKSD